MPLEISEVSSQPLLAWGRLTAPSAVRLVIPMVAKPRVQPMKAPAGFYCLPAGYSKWAAELQRVLAEIHPGPPMEGPLVARVVITKQRPAKTKLHAPLGDVDNYAKGIFDCCTKTARFWRDDVQIVELFASKQWGDADTIELVINTLED